MEGAASSSDAGRVPRGSGLPGGGMPSSGGTPAARLTAGSISLPGSAATDPGAALPGLGLGRPPGGSRFASFVRRAGRRLPPRVRWALRTLDRRARWFVVQFARDAYEPRNWHDPILRGPIVSI